MSDKIADVGKAENNPVSAWSVIELHREVSKLGAENARLKETIAAQQRQIKRMGQGWQPIETAPKDGTRVLLLGGTWSGEVCPSTVPSLTGMCEWRSGMWAETGGDFYSSWIVDPTHWMPIPDAPISPPRQQEQESQPVPVHPPCRVTHSGGE